MRTAKRSQEGLRVPRRNPEKSDILGASRTAKKPQNHLRVPRRVPKHNIFVIFFVSRLRTTRNSVSRTVFSHVHDFSHNINIIITIIKSTWISRTITCALVIDDVILTYSQITTITIVQFTIIYNTFIIKNRLLQNVHKAIHNSHPTENPSLLKFPATSSPH